MKKLISLLLGFFLVPAAIAHSNPFNGFYGSLNLGFLIPTIQDVHSVNFSIPALGSEARYNSAPNAFTMVGDGGITIGYSRLVDNALLFALQADANIESGKVSFDLTYTTRNTFLRTAVQTNATLYNQIGVMLKFGPLITPTTLLYTVVGPQWGYFKIASSVSYKQAFGGGNFFSSSVDAKKEAYNAGILVGLGIDQIVSQHVGIGILYTVVPHFC